jgi:hypothetical protein
VGEEKKNKLHACQCAVSCVRWVQNGGDGAVAFLVF